MTTPMVHLSHTPIDTVKSTVCRLTTGAKPHGLWFAEDGAWETLIQGQGSWTTTGNFKYEVDYDPNRVYTLASEHDIQWFENAFGVVADDGRMEIDWHRVSEFKDGIVITHLGDEYRWWLSLWDIPSGCIWRTRAATLR